MYEGIKDGESVYSGITNNVERRTAQHGAAGRDFVVAPLTTGAGLGRGEARAIEQAMIVRNAGQNIRNSISPSHSYYQQAVDWGEQWLQGMGR